MREKRQNKNSFAKKNSNISNRSNPSAVTFGGGSLQRTGSASEDDLNYQDDGDEYGSADEYDEFVGSSPDKKNLSQSIIEHNEGSRFEDESEHLLDAYGNSVS